METGAPHPNPVLHYLAVARAARDFGLEPEVLDRIATSFEPAAGADGFAEAAADAVLRASRPAAG